MPNIIRDMVHGYIEIEEEFLNIIDSVLFQRLRYIEQCSFRVLYPSARHDRFIHSLGVYHLSVLLSKHFKQDLSLKIKEYVREINIEGKMVGIDNEISKIITTFKYSALLHDIGHSPLSHTTEFVYEQSGCKNIIKNILEDVLKKCRYEKFCLDYDGAEDVNQHEYMSALLAITKMKDYQKEKMIIDDELCVRMITGIKYKLDDSSIDERLIKSIKNFFIGWLSSTTIDIDKLDYIKRDTIMAGFINSEVDIDRLFRSITLKFEKDGKFVCAFKKNVLSVLESVVDAKMFIKEWVQGHHATMYEQKLLINCIYYIMEHNKEYIIEHFCEDGIKKLLCDVDIISKFKELYFKAQKKKKYDTRILMFKEFFDRGCRRRALWKSYDEYKYLFGDDSDNVYNYLYMIYEALNSVHCFSLDTTTLDIIKGNKKCNSLNEVVEFDKNIITKMEEMEKFFNNNSISFNIVIIPCYFPQKASFFSDDDIIYIEMGQNKENNYVDYNDEYGKKDNSTDKKFFYLYMEKEDRIKINDIIKFIINEAKK